MVTRDTPYLIIDIIQDLFSVVTGNSYLRRGSNGNALCITTTGNVFVARWVMPLVAIPFLDFVMIH